MQIMSKWQQHFNYVSRLHATLVTSAAAHPISSMDVHMQDICTEKTCAVYSSAPPPAVEPVSCCQVLRFSAMEGCKRVGNPLWLCMSILQPAVFLLSLWKPQNGRSTVSVQLLSFPSAPTFPLSLYPPLLLGIKEPHFFLHFPFWPPFSVCQAVRHEYSLEAVIHWRVAVFLTTLGSK